MPSFLNDDNSPVLSNPDILDLDPNNHFGLASSKAPNLGSLRHDRSDALHETFDESSATSTQDSEVSDASPMANNANGTRPTSLSSLPNGRSHPTTQQSQPDDEHLDAGFDKPFRNGSTTTVLPDRTLAPRLSDAETNASADVTPRNSTTANIKDAISTGSRTNHDRLPKQSFEDSASQFSIATPAGLDARNSRSSIPLQIPASPFPEHTPAHRASPHRLSSPPIYQSVNSSAAGHLQPPVASPTLKQRHTLEVPKVSQSRISRDGADAATASGRFSPTTASGHTPSHRRASLNLARRATRSMQSDAPRDEIVPDEDAARYAEAYRQKRASKRKRKEEEDDDRVLVGTKVDESHANWVTAYNMLTGIRVSVSRTNAKLDRELTDADFEAKQKSTFDIAGNELVPSAKYDFKFKDYAPWVFRRLRSLFRLDPADYLVSLTGKYILSELGSPGKSGSFFYFSRDYKYIIKTIHHAEHKFLRKILKQYYQHVSDNPNTLLSQFYGLHRVKMPYGKKIHFVVMNNLFPPHRDIHTTFDLKGSTIGRDYKEEELEGNPRATLKDLNWLRRQRHLELGMQKKRLFLEQLQRDVVLLKRLKIMDYSLLIGIHDLSRGNDENLRGKTLQVFNPGGEKTSQDEPPSVLLRTPSKMENARKARELRQMIRQERPVPMGQGLGKMPDELNEGHSRPGFVFNQDDGGLQATHENDEPADEIYYLGVIDCLTHYGMIKKIEHFWKGLSSDRTQISALPPDQYGDRFYNFVEGITMSSEEAHREAERKDQEATAAASRASGERVSSRASRRKSGNGIPPMPNHLPPAPPPMGPRSPEAKETVEMAQKEARKTEMEGVSEKQVPDRTLRTTASPAIDSKPGEPVLPIVEEQGENNVGDSRPETPPKDKALPPTRAPPPTPPKTMAPMRIPDSADSGYAVQSSGTAMPQLRSRVSKESLNKNLPPLPT
ncbi:phosphatidylinositol-4-phosphate 5-Kinase domain-containing protein [Sarocladium implicatum]|nr:phosphatidylinositol-4-phosphate 5-Kinase domain-containing protein [Sarocladium implicatum]